MKQDESYIKLKTRQNEINEKLHIPSSVGIGTNLYLAKIALDITAKKSPDRIGWLTEEKYIEELLKVAAHCEQFSTHPIAVALCEAYQACRPFGPAFLHSHPQGSG